MENTLENKARFFAQYWGQKCYVGKQGLIELSILQMNKYCIESGYLQLKSILNLSNEDAYEVGRLHGGWKSRYSEIGKEVCINFFNGDFWVLPWQAVDYLRSKGYYVGEDNELDYGWVKLLD